MAYGTRRIEQIIRSIRRDTGNTDYSADSGIPQRDIEEYIQDAQDDLQTAIINVHAQRAFPDQALLNVVANEFKIALPYNFHSSGGLIKVEFSASGNSRDFYELRQVTLGEINETVFGNPSLYSRRGDLLIVSPVPQSAVTSGIRVTFVKTLPRPAVRRGQVSVATLNTSAKTITTLTLQINDGLLDAAGLREDDYICIVDRDGVIKMKAIPITTVNTDTGAVTIASGFVYETGETIAVGDYAISGRYATTHPEWPANVERYLRRYGVLRVQMRDSNDDMIAEDALLEKMRSDIVEDYISLNADIMRVPEINEDE